MARRKSPRRTRVARTKTAEPSPALHARIHARLSRYYDLDGVPDVDDFVRLTEGDSRETLLLRDGPDGLEIALHLPRAAVEAGHRACLDEICQIVEGVSHFLYIAERARRERPVTQLELELQAEVDKYVMLVDPCREGFRPAWGAAVRARLYDRVTFSHPPGTEPGDRYRFANDLAARFAGRLERHLERRGPQGAAETHRLLRRFYWAGQAEKIELARAA